MVAVASALAVADGGPTPSRRADAGNVRLGGRDVAGLLLCGDMYGAPYDLLAVFLGCGRTGCGGSWPGGAVPGTCRRAGSAPARRGAG
jgi:hypothetical protein